MVRPRPGRNRTITTRATAIRPRHTRAKIPTTTEFWGDVGHGFDVVHDRRFHVQALGGRKIRWLEPGFAALAFERDNANVMLQGCRQYNPQSTLAAGDEIVVSLATTAYYNSNYNTMVPTCPNAEALCDGRCSD